MYSMYSYVYMQMQGIIPEIIIILMYAYLRRHIDPFSFPSTTTPQSSSSSSLLFSLYSGNFMRFLNRTTRQNGIESDIKICAIYNEILIEESISLECNKNLTLQSFYAAYLFTIYLYIYINVSSSFPSCSFPSAPSSWQKIIILRRYFPWTSPSPT